MQTRSSNILSIDLGNDFMSLAYVDADGTPCLLRFDDGATRSPSDVYFDGQNAIVGRMARQMRSFDPERVVFSVFRRLGTPWSVLIDGVSHTAESVIAILLRHLASAAEPQMGPIQEVVLTIPASFDLIQKSSLQRAAAQAELKVAGMVSSPVAAQLNRQRLDGDFHGCTLVVDVGGYSLSAAILEVQGGDIRVLAIDGNPDLGGAAWTEAIMERVAAQWKAESGAGGDFEPRTRERLWRQCEQAKCHLSRSREARIEVFPPQQSPFESKISRIEFEELTSPLVNQIRSATRGLLDSASIVPSDLSHVILCGGASRMPSVARMLSEELNGDIQADRDPDTAAALGAAVFARELSHDQSATAVPANRSDETKHRRRRPPAKHPPETSQPSTTAPPLGLAETEKQEPGDDNVQFTVICPRRVAPARWYQMLAFAHLSERPADAPPDEPEPRERVRREARSVLNSDLAEFNETNQNSRANVPEAAELTFVPVIPGVVFNPPRQQILWHERFQRVEFRLQTQEPVDGRMLRGELTVFRGNILLADVPLAIKITQAAAATLAGAGNEQRATAKVYRHVFASYSHKDLPVVEQFEALVQALGDEVLRDWVHLRAGEVWNERLQEMIRQADVFQLFWSRNSMVSDFVRKEWEYALSLGRPRFVRPTYWEDPFPSAPGLPPDGLKSIHFHRLNWKRESESGVPQAPPPTPIGRSRRCAWPASGEEVFSAPNARSPSAIPRAGDVAPLCDQNERSFDSAMASEWYYAAGSNTAGPVGASQLRRLLKSGQITPETLVWKEEMSDWRPIAEVSEFAGVAGPPMPASMPAPMAARSRKGSRPGFELKRAPRQPLIMLFVALGLALLAALTVAIMLALKAA